MELSTLLQYGLQFLVAVPAIVFHEVAHGYAALYLGDPTAKNQGRLSLNPLKHIDPFGTIILPILMIIALGAGFGYAKPVPVNPRYFKDYRKGMFITAIAGPATNLALAAVAGLLFRIGLSLVSGVGESTTFMTIVAIVLEGLFFFASINLVLLFFNLIPIPPLDGSRVIPLFLPDSAMPAYHKLESYGFIIIFGLLLVVPRVFDVDPVGAYFSFTVEPLMRLFTGL